MSTATETTTAYSPREARALASFDDARATFDRIWNTIVEQVPAQRLALMELEAAGNHMVNAGIGCVQARLVRMLPHLADVCALACWFDVLDDPANHQPGQRPDTDEGDRHDD